MNGTEATSIEFSTIQSLVEQCTQGLSESKFRLMTGAFNPLTVLNLVKTGIDCFDSSYAYLVTQAQYALTFDLLGNEEQGFAIDLLNIQYKEDLNPLLADCNCLACRKHSRAYIYHLINCKELLGPTLLMIHNLHHYKCFFKAIRKAVDEEKLDILIDKMVKSFVSLKLDRVVNEKNKQYGKFSD